VRAPTLKDVAQRAGVGVVTASCVLNGAAKTGTRVSEETRRRILAAAAEVQYHPNAHARGLRRSRAHTLGVLFPTTEPAIVSNPYASGVLAGIVAECAARGYGIHLFTQPWEGAEKSARTFRDQRTDGVLVIAPAVGSDIAAGLEGLSLPTVVVSSPSGSASVPYVDVDNAAGARLAARHLLALGHRRIAHQFGDPTQASVAERRAAFLAELAAAGIAPPAEHLAGGSFDRDECFRIAGRLLSLPEPPTAVFATNDDIALDLVAAARSRGLRVPEDLSVVGFDDYPAARLVSPALTTVRHPLWEVGASAVRLLLERVEGEADTPPSSGPLLLAPELVVRASTAPVSS
jgi:LacI family transcriptional regulator